MKNTIHSLCSIDSSVTMGTGNTIGPFVVIGPNVTIGDYNIIESHAVIGSRAEHKKHVLEYGRVKIGNNNFIGNHTTIHTSTQSRPTLIMNKCWIMAHAHIGHDAILEDNVTVSCGALIGGFAYLMQGCNIALNATIHQRHVIGSYSMIGMNGVVPKIKIINPGTVHVGNPVSYLKVNNHALKTYGVSANDLLKEHDRFSKIKMAMEA